MLLSHNRADWYCDPLQASFQSPTELSEVSSAPSIEGSSLSLESAEAAVHADPLSNASQTSLQAREHVVDLLDEGTFVPVTPFAEDVHHSHQLTAGGSCAPFCIVMPLFSVLKAAFAV